MDEAGVAARLDEVDRLLNDPDVPMQAELVWTLLAEVAVDADGRF